MDLSKLRYTKTHEWAYLEGNVCTVGISKFAADQLTDVTFIELPHVGDHVFKGEEFGNIETVKAVSDLYSPVGGEVVAINEKLHDDPNLVTQAPYGAGWLIKVTFEDGTNLDALLNHLLTPEEYQKQVESEGH
jgi:glycine cleavage system H protein